MNHLKVYLEELEISKNWEKSLQAIKEIYGVETRVINDEIRKINYVIYLSDECFLRCILKRDIRKNYVNVDRELLRDQSLIITYLDNGIFKLSTENKTNYIIYDAINKHTVNNR